MAENLDTMESEKHQSKVQLKYELEDDSLEEEEDDSEPLFGPAALGLHRVGTKLPPKPTPSEPLQKLNARGMPARIRKKNKFLIEEFDDSTPSPKKNIKNDPKTPLKIASAKKKSPKKKKPTPSYREDQKFDNVVASPDRKSGQKIGMRLRNLLKLPKAHKWVCFEYFYSNIDKALFDGENDFMICLKESFPHLTNRKLTQMQWTKIRRMMGKPRRCSQAFFAEERKELDRKRKLIRYLQQRKSVDISIKDLPNEIPLQLTVGTKVTARLRKPQDGLFTGYIDAVDTSNNTYRITFERPKLGTHSVPDYEVLSNDPPDTISLASIATKQRQRIKAHEIYNFYSSYNKPPKGDPMIGCTNIIGEQMNNNTTLGGYPFRFMELIVLMSKVLEAKRVKIHVLNEFNTEAELRKSFGEKVPDDFEKRYASAVIDLEKMNLDLQEIIKEVQVFCQQIAPGASLDAMLAPTTLREKCKEEAASLVAKNHNGNIKDKSILDIITGLTALMLQVKNLADSGLNGYEMSVLQGTMEQIKLKLHPKYLKLFQNSVEIHMLRIQMGLAPIPSNHLAGS